MDPVLKKLNYKNQKEIVVLDAPENFEQHLSSLEGVKIIRQLEQAEVIEFALIFVIKQRQIDATVPLLAQKLKGDAIIWFCYPKGTSKKYKCDFNRDTGWAVLGAHNLSGVRMVAIDEDWSALRFRNVLYIKN